MLNLQHFLKPRKDDGSFADALPPRRFLTEQVFMTQAGHLGMVVKIEGRDPGCMTDQMLASTTDMWAKALRSLDERFRIYQYAIKTRGAKVAGDGIRSRFLEERGLFDLDLCFVILFDPGVLAAIDHNSLSTRDTLRGLSAWTIRMMGFFTGRVAAFVSETAFLSPRIVEAPEIFCLFRTLVNLDSELATAYPLVHRNRINRYLPDYTPIIFPDGFSLGGRHVSVYMLRDVPRQTCPNLLGEIAALPADFVLCTEYAPLSNKESRAQITAGETHHYSRQFFKNPGAVITMLLNRFFGKKDKEDIVPDKSAGVDLDEIGNLSKAIGAGDVLGEFSTTIIFHSSDKAEVDASAKAIGLLGRYEGSLVRETLNSLNAYLATIPGNTAFNLRKHWFLRSSYAHMSLLFAANAGNKWNSHLNRPYLLPVETEDHRVHYLNLHYQDVCGVFVTGATGSGKSVLAVGLLDHLQQYKPRTCILDIGGSYRQLCQKYDGSYASLELSTQNWKINPFALEATRDNFLFLHTFVTLLLTSNGYEPTHEDSRSIYEAIMGIYARPGDRRLSGLKLTKHLRDALYNWTSAGQDGSVFDNVEDTISFAEFQVFDLHGLEDHPKLIEPLLFYLFHRQTQIVTDPKILTTFKMLWADEVHRFLSNETCRRQFVLTGKTVRKHNGGLGLVTQSSFDLANVGLLEIISEVCPTKILLANPGADFEAYASAFHLNEKELESFRTLKPKQQFMLKRADEPAQVLNLHLSPTEYWQSTTDPFDRARRDKAIEELGYEAGIKSLAVGGSK